VCDYRRESHLKRWYFPWFKIIQRDPTSSQVEGFWHALQLGSASAAPGGQGENWRPVCDCQEYHARRLVICSIGHRDGASRVIHGTHVRKQQLPTSTLVSEQLFPLPT